MSENLPPINFKQIKVISCVSRCGSLAAAGSILGRSASAIGKSIKEFENAIGEPVFEISNQRRVPKDAYRQLFRRADTIIGIFEDLAAEYQNSHSRPRDVRALPIFSMDLSTNRLRKLAILDDTQSIEKTAEICQQSVSAVYKFLHELEDQLQSELFARLPNGRYIPISYGDYLCRRIRLALSELRLAYQEAVSLQGKQVGQLVIGCLPSMRAFILPRALALLAKDMPELRIRIEAGSYPQMAQDLMRGTIDVVIGGARSSRDSKELVTEVLAEDKICIQARTGHPLAQCKELTSADLSNARWVLPLKNTPSRAIFEQSLTKSDIRISHGLIETGATTALGGIMRTDDLLTIGTFYQTHHERVNGNLVVLPFHLADNEWPIGYTLRKDTQPSAALSKFVECLRVAIDSISDEERACIPDPQAQTA